MFNRFVYFWPNSYQLGSLGKSHQNGDYLKQAMRKNCLLIGIEPAAFGLPVHWVPIQNVKNILIDLVLKSYNKQVAGFKLPKLSIREDVFSSAGIRAVDR